MNSPNSPVAPSSSSSSSFVPSSSSLSSPSSSTSTSSSSQATQTTYQTGSGSGGGVTVSTSNGGLSANAGDPASATITLGPVFGISSLAVLAIVLAIRWKRHQTLRGMFGLHLLDGPGLGGGEADLGPRPALWDTHVRWEDVLLKREQKEMEMETTMSPKWRDMKPISASYVPRTPPPLRDETSPTSSSTACHSSTNKLDDYASSCLPSATSTPRPTPIPIHVAVLISMPSPPRPLRPPRPPRSKKRTPSFDSDSSSSYCSCSSNLKHEHDEKSGKCIVEEKEDEEDDDDDECRPSTADLHLALGVAQVPIYNS